MNKKFLILLFGVVFAFYFLLFVSGALAATLGISGNRSTVDGQQKFLILVSYFDALDAASLNQDLDYLKSKGVDGIRVFPNWWESTGPAVFSNNTLFDSNGNIRPKRMTDLKGILDAANSRGMIVDISFARETVGNLSVSDYKKGVETAVNQLKSYGNVFYDLQNEANGQTTFLSELDIIDLKQKIKNISSNIILSTSAAYGISPSQTVSFVNRTGMDITNYHEPRTGSWPNNVLNDTTTLLGAGQPVYFSEPPREESIAGLSSQDFLQAASDTKEGGGAAWTFHTDAGFILDNSDFQSNLSSNEISFLNQFRQVVDSTTWGSGITGTGGGPTGPQGICPAGQISLASANASNADSTSTAGIYCDNDPPEATNVRYPVSGILKCDASSGTAFITTVTSRCQTWNFDVSGNPVGINLIAAVNCPGSIPVTIQNGNITAGAWTSNPSTEGAVCIDGTVTGSGQQPPPGGGQQPPPQPNPQPPGPTTPQVLSINPNTAKPGEQIKITGVNLTQNITLKSLNDGLTYEAQTSLTDSNRATIILASDIPIGTYVVLVENIAMTGIYLTVSLQAAAPVLPNPPPAKDLGDLIENIFAWSLYLVGLAVLVNFLWAGWLWFTSAGSTTKIAQAKEKMWNAIIGFLILLAAYLILNTINPDLVKGIVKLPGITTPQVPPGQQPPTGGQQPGPAVTIESTVEKNLGPGIVPDIAFYNNKVWVAFFDQNKKSVELYSGSPNSPNLSDLTLFTSFPLQPGALAFPRLTISNNTLWLAYRDEPSLKLWRMDTNTTETLEPAGGNDPVALGYDYIAWQRPISGFPVMRRSLGGGTIVNVRSGAPSGISRILPGGSVKLIDEDRNAVQDFTMPWWAGNLTVAELPSGGVAAFFNNNRSTLFTLWAGQETNTPHAAFDGANLYAVGTWGAPGVRISVIKTR